MILSGKERKDCITYIQSEKEPFISTGTIASVRTSPGGATRCIRNVGTALILFIDLLIDLIVLNLSLSPIVGIDDREEPTACDHQRGKVEEEGVLV